MFTSNIYRASDTSLLRAEIFIGQKVLNFVAFYFAGFFSAGSYFRGSRTILKIPKN